MDVGAAHGYTPGTILSVAGQDMRVRIDQLGLFASRVAVITAGGPVPDGTPVAVGATVIPGDGFRLPVRVAVSDGQPTLMAVARQVAEFLRSEPFLDVLQRNDDVADVVVRLHPTEGGRGYVFTLAYPGGRVDRGGSVQSTDPRPLGEAIRGALTQAYAVRRLAQLTNPHASFSVRLSTDRGSDQPVFGIGEPMELRITATAECYVTLIDIGTSGSLTVLYPPAGREPPRLWPGQVLRLPPKGSFRVTGPAGLDRVKVIATRRKLPLSAAVQTKGVRVQLVADQILSALRGLTAPSRRKSVGEVAIPASEWTETSLAIEIK
ncbi:MAG: DUF4384 domain-containing protein [Phycisphaerae bacterium]